MPKVCGWIMAAAWVALAGGCGERQGQDPLIGRWMIADEMLQRMDENYERLMPEMEASVGAESARRMRDQATKMQYVLDLKPDGTYTLSAGLDGERSSAMDGPWKRQGDRLVLEGLPKGVVSAIAEPRADRLHLVFTYESQPALDMALMRVPR